MSALRDMPPRRPARPRCLAFQFARRADWPGQYRTRELAAPSLSTSGKAMGHRKGFWTRVKSLASRSLSSELIRSTNLLARFSATLEGLADFLKAVRSSLAFPRASSRCNRIISH